MYLKENIPLLISSIVRNSLNKQNIEEIFESLVKKFELSTEEKRQALNLLFDLNKNKIFFKGIQ